MRGGPAAALLGGDITLGNSLLDDQLPSLRAGFVLATASLTSNTAGRG